MSKLNMTSYLLMLMILYVISIVIASSTKKPRKTVFWLSSIFLIFLSPAVYGRFELIPFLLLPLGAWLAIICCFVAVLLIIFSDDTNWYLTKVEKFTGLFKNKTTTVPGSTTTSNTSSAQATETTTN